MFNKKEQVFASLDSTFSLKKKSEASLLPIARFVTCHNQATLGGGISLKQGNGEGGKKTC